MTSELLMGLGILGIGLGVPVIAALATIMYVGVKNQIDRRREPPVQFKVDDEDETEDPYPPETSA